MNKLNLLKISTLSFVLFFGLISCNNDADKNNETSKDTLAVVEDSHMGGVDIDTKFKLPSPVELYMFLWDSNAKFNKDALNPIDKAVKYLTTTSKALNLGIYSSDLAYCTVFGKNQETFTYFSTTKKIAEDLGLTEGFDESIAKRLDVNINNSDSLYQITNDSYSDITRYLDSQGKSELLPLMVAGGWIESVYVNVKSVGEFHTDIEIANVLADQGVLLETINEYLNSLESKSDDVKDIISKFQDLATSFDKLYDNDEGVVITESQFNEISDKIEKIRNSFVK